MRLLYKSLIFLCCCFLIFSACKEVEVDVDYEFLTVDNFIIPQLPVEGIPIVFDTPTFETNSESVFAENNTTADKIERIRLVSMELIITSPEDANFNFLKNISFKIGAQGLSLVQIAFKNDIPDNAMKNLLMEVTQTDLKNYLKKDKIYLNIELLTDQPTDFEIEVEVRMKYLVEAKVILNE
ncbi:MAG: hypothetical protein JEZ03_05040 [Bacteroidales bacterium]|nr:hypothetical protein [Bacteroidales bacterium]